MQRCAPWGYALKPHNFTAELAWARAEAQGFKPSHFEDPTVKVAHATLRSALRGLDLLPFGEQSPRPRLVHGAETPPSAEGVATPGTEDQTAGAASRDGDIEPRLIYTAAAGLPPVLRTSEFSRSGLGTPALFEIRSGKYVSSVEWG